MNVLRVLLVFLALGTLAFASSTILIFDASGSMADSVSGTGKTKIEIAKEAGNTFLNNVNSGDEVALIVFYDCGDIKTEVPFTTDFQQIRDKMAGLTPQSSTPIAKSIDYAANYAQTSGKSGAAIIILTDGEETCDSHSDAVTSAQNAVSGGAVKIINVVGFTVGNTTSTNLQEIATAGKGNYYGANDAGQLAASLTQAYQSGSGTCCLPSMGLPALVGAAIFFSRKR